MVSSLEQAIRDICQGKPILLTDAPDRENEGDFVIAAERATRENMATLLRYSTRMICVPMQEDRLQFLGLEPVTRQPTRPGSCCFYTPVDARHGDTGLSIADRLIIFDALLYDQTPVTTPYSRLSIPGHTFPLRGHPQGLSGRQGHTEGSLALMHLAELAPAAVISELWDDERHQPLKGNDVLAFARHYRLTVVSIPEICGSI